LICTVHVDLLERLQKIAFVTFTEQSAVRLCMNGPRQAFTIDGCPVTVQRWLPFGLTIERSYRLLLFLETSSSDSILNENEIRAYFDTQFGQTKAFDWKSDKVATVDFDE
jgi:hypothetical protein